MNFAVLRFNFASPGGDPRKQGELLSAALEMAEWAESRGVLAVSIDEHHATGHGWSCNPIMTAGMFLARTKTMIASVDCALGPLWNSVRLAEDIALADAVSSGRLHTTLGLGYRPIEYDALGVDFARRGQLMDQTLETVLRVWSGDAVAEPDRTPICSGTRSSPHPPLYVGGGVRATARRAVRFRLPLNIPAHRPDLADYYRQLCAEAGVRPIVIMPPKVNRGMIYLHEDPDEAWARYGEHILWEAVTYGAWSGDRVRSVMHLPGVRTIDEVRESGIYRFLTPEQLVDEVRADPAYGAIALHGLVGGMPIDAAWESLQLLTDKVLPALK
ncbi:LLM class flavin-dependent oxidoreductase [Jongsikchunia kroppenstedtii]|uniref:LLM class flavin-dependent oxidoreductase n=1 Tax=Jongsikchunia kroppenstedtii TaxID=1121721 RepID=UPI000374A4A7|nr:LLM class flavin-dependent oxidoreductase [Jongsikchunia kroppenstedtii]